MPRQTRPAPAADASAPRRNAAPALSLADALAPFEERLRQDLPSAQDILLRAANRRQSRRHAVAGSALAVLAAVVLWLDPAYRHEDIRTAVGERGRWTAPDGSEIALNSGSHLRVAWHLRSRRLYLDQGEASFQVAHAPWHALAPWAERRFTVDTADLQVEDIGTVFNVRTGMPQGTQVTVIEGRVRVHQPGQAPHELQAGQALQGQADGGLGAPHAVDAAQRTAWREGRLLLDRTPLDQVVAELQRHRPAPIVLSDPALADLRLSGQFDLNRVEQLIGLLPTLLPVRVEQRANGEVHVRARTP